MAPTRTQQRAVRRSVDRPPNGRCQRTAGPRRRSGAGAWRRPAGTGRAGGRGRQRWCRPRAACAAATWPRTRARALDSGRRARETRRWGGSGDWARARPPARRCGVVRAVFRRPAGVPLGGAPPRRGWMTWTRSGCGDSEEQSLSRNHWPITWCRFSGSTANHKR